MLKAEISTIEEEFEELEKGRGPDKKPRKKRMADQNQWTPREKKFLNQQKKYRDTIANYEKYIKEKYPDK